MAAMSDGKRRTRRSAPTKEIILQAAARMFAEHGYEATSLESVAVEAGVTKATLYYHFDSKEAIYAAVLTRYLAEANAQVQADIEQGGSASEIFLRILHSQLDDTLDPAKRYIHYQELVSTDSETHQAVRKAQRQYEETVAQVIRRGQEAGEFLEGDPKVLAFLVIGTMGRTARWFRPGGRISTQEFRKTIANLLLGGLIRNKDSGEIAKLVAHMERPHPADSTASGST